MLSVLTFIVPIYGGSIRKRHSVKLLLRIITFLDLFWDINDFAVPVVCLLNVTLTILKLLEDAILYIIFCAELEYPATA